MKITGIKAEIYWKAMDECGWLNLPGTIKCSNILKPKLLLRNFKLYWIKSRNFAWNLNFIQAQVNNIEAFFKMINKGFCL